MTPENYSQVQYVALQCYCDVIVALCAFGGAHQGRLRGTGDCEKCAQMMRRGLHLPAFLGQMSSNVELQHFADAWI